MAVRADFDAYWKGHMPNWQSIMGETTWLGGDAAMAADNPFVYGKPFADEGCRIRVLAPSEALPLDPLGFSDGPQIRAVIQTGYDQMGTAIEHGWAEEELSYPVPPDKVLTNAQAAALGLPAN
jgi:hypothetical protein